MAVNKAEWGMIENSLHAQREARNAEEHLTKKLFQAVRTKNKSLIKKISQQISLSSKFDNLTALFIATELNDEDLVFYLLELGANINTMIDGVDASWIALKNSYTDLFKLLIQNGATLNHKNKGETRLIQAVKLSNVSAVRFLLNHGVKNNEVDKEGKTALHYNFLKSPYTETDKEIGAMLVETGCSPLQEDLEEIPAYGYLDDVDDIAEFYDVKSLPLLNASKQYKVNQIKTPKEVYEAPFVKEAKRIAAISKENKAKNPQTTSVKRPSRLP